MEILDNLLKTETLIKENIQSQEDLKKLKKNLNHTDANILILVISIIASIVLLIIYHKLFTKISSYLPSDIILAPFFLFVAYIVVFNLPAFLIGKLLKKGIINKRFKKNKTKIESFKDKVNGTYSDLENNSILPKKYWNTYSVSKMVEYIQNKRADTLKETINLFEDEELKRESNNSLNNINNGQKQIQKQILVQTLLSATTKRNLIE